jgi:epoxyqueuosine reductase
MEAEERGFAAVGVARAEPSDHAEFLRRWLDAGHHAGMDYLATPESVERREDVRRSLEGARSVVVVADAYPARDEPQADDPSRAVIARYARGRDYHHVLAERLRALAEWLEGEAAVQGEAEAEGRGGPEVRSRVWVDTGPVLEREWAQRAGLGWFGRNTMLIRPGVGSYLFLGVLVTTLELDPDPPFEADRCGTCRACLDACPTGALLGRDEDGAPVMDAGRCISYLTIENRGPIPIQYREAMGNRVFGCDICQEVCPWPRTFGPRQEVRPEYEAVAWPADREGKPSLPSLDGPDLVEFTERILAMSGKEYRRVFAESPLARPGRKRMLRNLCVALGNYGRTSAGAAERVRPVLERAAADASEMVREHAEWGLDQLEWGLDQLTRG